jgi:hypothetical protein
MGTTARRPYARTRPLPAPLTPQRESPEPPTRTAAERREHNTADTANSRWYPIRFSIEPRPPVPAEGDASRTFGIIKEPLGPASTSHPTRPDTYPTPLPRGGHDPLPALPCSPAGHSKKYRRQVRKLTHKGYYGRFWPVCGPSGQFTLVDAAVLDGVLRHFDAPLCAVAGNRHETLSESHTARSRAYWEGHAPIGLYVFYWRGAFPFRSKRDETLTCPTNERGSEATE